MSTEELQILYFFFFIAVIFHVIAGIITMAFVIPLQFEQTKVKNGLIPLRKQLLAKGVLSLVVIVMSILALTGRWLPFDGMAARYAMILFVMAHGIGILGKSIIDYKIYHTQYSPENKKLHEKIAVIEKGMEARKAEAQSK